MKNVILFSMLVLCAFAGNAQTDTTISNTGDTVKVGNFVIIRNKKGTHTNDDSVPPRRENYAILRINHNRYFKAKTSHDNSTISTNYWVFDLGFANYNDKTDYTSAAAQSFAPGLNKNDLKLVSGKSSNVNIWIFMQRLNVAARVLNLKYGLGLEMFNFRYKNNISYHDNPSSIYQDTINFSKDKLFTSYATVPLMLNINPFPNRRHGFSVSAGVSAGYRIGSHTKQKSGEFGKEKNHDDFNLAPWRFAYVAELGLGPVRLYGSYSIKPMFQNSIDQYPYTIGLRFSNW